MHYHTFTSICYHVYKFLGCKLFKLRILSGRHTLHTTLQKQHGPYLNLLLLPTVTVPTQRQIMYVLLVFIEHPNKKFIDLHNNISYS